MYTFGNKAVCAGTATYTPDLPRTKQGRQGEYFEKINKKIADNAGVKVDKPKNSRGLQKIIECRGTVRVDSRGRLAISLFYFFLLCGIEITRRGKKEGGGSRQQQQFLCMREQSTGRMNESMHEN